MKLLTILGACAVLAIASCGGGRIVTRDISKPDGTRIVETEIVQPKKAVSPATVEHGSPASKDPVFSASTGATQKVDTVAIKRASIVTYAGIGLIVLAIITFVLRAWVPVVPVGASLVAGGVGVGLLFLPNFFNPWVTWILLGAGAVVLVLYLTGTIDNWTKLRKQNGE